MRTWRFVTLMLTALAMSIAFCHLLALPTKLAYQGPVWLPQAVWWAGVVPVNAEVAALTAPTLPPEWTLLRVQWEYAHAVRAVLQVAALGALVLSVIGETPRRV